MWLETDGERYYIYVANKNGRIDPSLTKFRHKDYAYTMYISTYVLKINLKASRRLGSVSSRGDRRSIGVVYFFTKPTPNRP